MNLKTITRYRINGKRRRIRLFGSWENLQGRISGRLHAGNGARPWLGIGCEFTGWEHFRAWALANGYSKTHCSLDRMDGTLGYTPANCRWVTREQNSRFQHMQSRYKAGGYVHGALPA